MARGSIEQQQKRLKLKAEELRLRVNQQENTKKIRDIKQQLKVIGGRVR